MEFCHRLSKNSCHYLFVALLLFLLLKKNKNYIKIYFEKMFGKLKFIPFKSITLLTLIKKSGLVFDTIAGSSFDVILRKAENLTLKRSRNAPSGSEVSKAIDGMFVFSEIVLSLKFFLRFPS